MLGAAVVFGLFGVAAFVQPAIGEAFLGGQGAAQGWYDAVFNSAQTLAPAAAGLLLFSAASVVMAWSLAGHPCVPRWLALLFGLTGPFIGFLGLIVSVLQPLGGGLLALSGTLLAVRLGPASPDTDARARPRASSATSLAAPDPDARPGTGRAR